MPAVEERHNDNTATEDVAEGTRQLVKSQAPWLEWVTRAGWGAKGLVYLLMGLTALNIVFAPTDDAASPEGALGRVQEQPGGRALLLLLGAGLLLYVAWRLLTVAMIAGTHLAHWLDRIGYTLSALFYVALSWTALKSVLQDTQPEDGNTIERISRALLDNSVTRVLLGIGGLVTIGVALYFVVDKAVRRSFTDDLDGVGDDVGGGDGYGRLLLTAGVVGWTGRGIVTALVGFFVVRSAARFDPSDARGFDRALHHVATSGPGAALLVAVAAAGLMVYGAYCLLSIPRRRLQVDR